MSRLSRSLGLMECVFFGVGSILGAGIYTLIGKIAGHSGNLIWVSLLITSSTAFLTALSYAELSSAFPKAGGEYVYAKKAFGKVIGTQMGILVSLNGIIVGAAVAIGFGGYLATLTGLQQSIGIFGILGLAFAVNSAGIRQSSLVNIVFTTIEVVGLLLIIYFSYPYVGKVDLLEMPPNGLHGILAASSLAFFAYVGFEEIVKLAEETKDPEKNIPRALLFSSIIVAVVYLLVGLSVVSVVPYSELSKSQSPLADVLAKTWGKNGLIAISVIALFATSNTILSNMIGSSRILLDLAEDTVILRRLAYISPRRKTPVTALICVLVTSILFTQAGNLEQIARISTVFIFLAFALIHLAVIVLRYKEKNLARPFKIPFTIGCVPLPCAAGLLMCILLLAYTLHALLFAA